ncbi:MAG: hypothetical protein HC892_14685 [Saprospiraceae bacterium]|nr:hypothetical protein [Saprospiraceae bacterium]
MGNQHSYQDLVNKVTMYLDNALSEAEEIELLKEIKLNPEYFSVLSKERSFREFLKSRVHKRKVSPSLVQSIKDKIQYQPGVPTK